MTNEEVNEIICEYVGFRFCGFMSDTAKVMAVVRERDNEPNYIPTFTSDLNSLVPVWEKMREVRNGLRESYRLTVFKDKYIADYSCDNWMGILTTF